MSNDAADGAPSECTGSGPGGTPDGLDPSSSGDTQVDPANVDPPLPAVVLCEPNRTRADLYRHWLETYEVRVAVTKTAADDAIDDDVAVGVLAESFADGDAGDVVDVLEARSPMARVVTTRDQSAAFPSLSGDEELAKPVFEDELRDVVETLIHRANFHLALKAHYQVAIGLTSMELDASSTGVDPDRYETLERRAAELQTIIALVTHRMEEEDIEAVRRSITVRGELGPADDGTGTTSKYLPLKCAKCGGDWSGAGPDGDDPVVKLGAHVWRCKSCGHVHMGAAPGEGQVGSYRS